MNKIYWKGRLVSPKRVRISPLNTSFLFGEALFESLPVYGGKPLFFREHLERLKRGCRFLSWPFISEVEFKKAIRLFSKGRKGDPDFLIRFNLVQELEGSGNPREFIKKTPTLFAIVRPLRHQLRKKNPILGKVGISPWMAFDKQTLPNNFKIPYYMTTRWVFRKNPRWKEILRLNQRGEVVDGGASTPMWFDGKTVHVPPLKMGGLESVTRKKIIQMIKRLGLPVVEKAWKPAELLKKQNPHFSKVGVGRRSAKASVNQELFFVGSGVGVMAASHLMNRKIMGIPKVTEKLWSIYRHQAMKKSR